MKNFINVPVLIISGNLVAARPLISGYLIFKDYDVMKTWDLFQRKSANNTGTRVNPSGEPLKNNVATPGVPVRSRNQLADFTGETY